MKHNLADLCEVGDLLESPGAPGVVPRIGTDKEHIDRPIRVADLSALLELSQPHFSRVFRLSYGETPHAYILRRRVELAAQLMLASRAPLSEIALKCGFHDQAHLSKQFRRLTGEPPAAWRRLRRAL